MYFRIPEYLYLACTHDGMVGLDLEKDQYKIIPARLANALDFAVHHEFISSNGQYCLSKSEPLEIPEGFDAAITYLLENRLLSKSDYQSPSPVNFQKNQLPTGAGNIDWRLSSDSFDKKVSVITFLRAYYCLLKVDITLKYFGFYALIKMIKRKKSPQPIKHNAEKFSYLVSAMNQVCLYYPKRTKCLEWAAALTLLAFQKNWACNLEIGVQLLPFVAHAWVKASDGIIADDESLGRSLAVVLSEPFERV